jgi:hypothetical protein
LPRRQVALGLIGALFLLGAGAAPGVAQAPAQRSAPPPLTASEPQDFSEHDALFAFHRLARTEPDFTALAAQAVADRAPARAHARDPEAERRWLVAVTARRLRAEFEAFDLDRPFRAELGADILGDDRERGGIPIDLGARPSLVLRHPGDPDHPFELRFRNAHAVTVIPVPGAEAAEGLLRGAGLTPRIGWSDPGSVTVTFMLAGLLPRIAEVNEIPFAAEILTARVTTMSGRVLHVFDRVGSPAAAAASRIARPALSDARIGGLRLGIPLEQAWAIVARTLPERLGDAAFDVLPDHARRFGVRPNCSAGLVADINAFGIALAPQDSYGMCLSITAAGPDDPLAGRVAGITSLRFLPGATEQEARADLQERFGPPLEEVLRGQLVWVGLDPAPGATDALLEVRAEFTRVAEGGASREPGLLLAVEIRRFVPRTDPGS